jgi:hypothetical protein
VSDQPTADQPAAGESVIDLDQARGARNFTAKAPIVIVLDGRRYRCRPELPVEFVEAIQSERAGAAFAALVQDPATPAEAAEYGTGAELVHGMTMEDLQAVAEGIAQHYGVTLGKSPAPGS